MEINPDALEIEIVDIEPIDGGVQVFARSWSDGEQIGFGKDGTVDIERFRIFNPPILVDDLNGDIVIESDVLDPFTGVTTKRYRTVREDPEQALLNSLQETIREMERVHDDKKIIKNKRGNTTSTIYTNFDAYTYNLNTSPSSWDTVRGASTGVAKDVNDLQARAGYGAGRICTRSNITFDTSVIGTDNITSAIFSVYGQLKSDGDTSSTILTSSSPASPTAITGGDYNNYDYLTSTVNQTYGSQAISAFSTSAYNNFTLTADGLAYINKTGFTVFGLVNSRDFDNLNPSGDNYAQTESSAYAGTTRDPKLVVEHDAGGGGPTPNNSARRLLLMQM